jgi:hypothetical protein
MATSPNSYFATANPLGGAANYTWEDPNSRPLTEGEIALAYTIYKDSIDYKLVRIHEKGFPFYQKPGTGFTPAGEIYVKERSEDCSPQPTSCLSQPDYSTATPYTKSFFLHEMVHIWQYQLGFSVFWHGIFSFFSGDYIQPSKNESPEMYKYDAYSATQTKFSDFNYEQQGDIIADYYLATGPEDKDKYDPQVKLPGLKNILSDFLVNPNDKKLLPK